MKDILIWKIDDEIVEKIDELSSKKNLSRNEFIINYLIYISELDNLFCVFNRYETLLKRVEHSLKVNADILERIDY